MADIALATIPLVTKVFTGCLDGYSLFTTAQQLGKDSQTLLWKFRIQETRLRLWGREWGLLADGEVTAEIKVRIEEDFKSVHETLGRISDLLQDYKKLKSRYGLTLVTDDKLYIAQTDSNSLEEMIAKDFDQYCRLDTELKLQRNKSNRFMKKFRWAVADKSKLEAMITDLKDYNDGLYHLLSAIERRRFLHGLPPELVTSNDRAVLNDLNAATHSQAQGLRDVIALRQHGLEVQSAAGNTSATRVSLGDTRLPFEAIGFPINISPLESRTIASYRRDQVGGDAATSVLVEWKVLGEAVSHAVRMSHQNRIEGLAQLLHISNRPEGLCVPKCLGYISDDISRLGLVYEYSIDDNWDSTSEPTSLRKLLARDIPYLGQRFRLAYKLALSLSILHTAGWLHKGLRSSNIIFGSSVPLSDPHIVGFEYARPNTAYAYSSLTASSDHEENLYRHPKAQGPVRERFRRAFDIYALGIILLEIGYWRRVLEFWVAGHTRDTFCEDLWSFHIPNLGAKVGKIYMDVVNNCINGDIAGEETDEMESQRRFYREIVRPLSSLVA